VAFIPSFCTCKKKIFIEFSRNCTEYGHNLLDLYIYIYIAASSAECRAGRRVIVQSLENCSLSLGSVNVSNSFVADYIIYLKEALTVGHQNTTNKNKK